MKKWIALAISLAMLTGLLSGCGTTPPAQSASPVAPPPSASVPAPAAPEQDVGFRLVDEDGNTVSADRSATGKNGVVSAPRYEAAEIGVEILKAGGNAVDAAVATAFAVAVAEPFSNGLGGGGFMTLHLATGENIFLDFREYAPAAATDKMYLKADGTVDENAYTYGGAAVAIPGTTAGLLYMLEHYGTMTREEVMRPAIKLAEEGYIINPLTKWALDDGYALLSGNEELRAIYTNDMLPLEQGDYIKNPNMAKALELIAKNGRDGFYKGELAQAIVDSCAAQGGILTLEDLEAYDVKVMEPVSGTYRGYQIFSSPLPSSGGTHLIQILNILEHFDIPSMKPYGVDHTHLTAEAQKLAYMDRAEYMGDPNYVKVPLNGLVSKDYAAKLAAKIDLTKAQNYTADDPWQFEGNDTQHLSVADKDGNMVGITSSLNYYWGSQVVVDGYGFLLNNHMNDFDPEPGGPNSVAAGKKPLSSMSPTVVLKEDGSPFMVLGAPGGSTIFAQVAQVIVDVIDFKMDMQQAVDAPRIIDATNCVLRYQIDLDPGVAEQLAAMGHETNGDLGEDQFGYIQAVLYGDDGLLHGAGDRYSDAAAVGY